MTQQEWILVATFGGTVILMYSTRLRPDLIALLAALALAMLGVMPPGDVLSGLGSGVVLTLISVFILAEGLDQTGVVRSVAKHLSRVAGMEERRVLLTLMVAGATLSLGMNNVAVGALLLPVSVRMARSADVPVASLLLPVSYATLLGGMATYFTTANIIMSDLLIRRGAPPLRMMDFFLTGGLIAVLGIAYMLVIGRRLLVRREGDTQDTQRDLPDLYRLWERVWEVTVPESSGLVGMTIEEARLGERLGLVVLAVRRRGRDLFMPGPATALLAGDAMTVLGREDRVRMLGEWDVEVEAGPSPQALSGDLELTEVVILPRSRVRGMTLAELKLRTRVGIMALALFRGGRVIRTDVGKTPLEVGDGLLVVNRPHGLDELARGGDFVVTGGEGGAPRRPERWAVALLIALGVLAVSFSGAYPIGPTAFAGALAMIVTGCLGTDSAYRSIEWHVVFLVAGLLPLGYGMIHTGLADRVADLLGTAVVAGSPLLVVAVMFALTVLVTQVVGGQVSALLVGPVALSVASVGEIPVHAMAVAVAIGASTAFLTPMAHPVNAMMMGTAGYRPGDFGRVGAGMTIVVLTGLMVGMVLFWGVG